MGKIAIQIQRLNIALGAILLLGLGLRLWGISFGLPHMYHPDEGVPVGIALKILHTGNLNPEFFNWPALLFYLNALVYSGYFVLGRMAGRFASPSDLPYPDIEIMAVGRATLPDEFLLGRGLTALFGTFSILLVYLICRQFDKGRTAAWLAALLMAVDVVDVKHSQFIRPDTFAVFFALVAVLFALKIVDDPHPRNYALAAIGAGLAASSKYNVAIIFVALVTAHWVRFQWSGLLRRELYLAVLVGLAAFLFTNPFVILDASRFLKIGPLEDASIYATGHPGAEGDTFQWYVTFLWATQGLVLLLALGEALAILFQRERKGIVLLSFPLLYFAFINFFTVHFDTTILPILPFLFVLAGLGVARVYAFLLRRWAINRTWVGALMILLVIVLALPAVRATAAYNARLLQPDGREQARQWIDANMPLGSRVALEAYSPYVDRKEFVVMGFYGLQDHTPDWYVLQGFEYLVFSQGTFGRYFADPARYKAQIDRYNALFSGFTPVTRFDDNDYEIRIYKTGVALPVHRVAARFGDYGDLVELIGYDDIRWVQGEPLSVRLFWRTLRDTPEPLALELRLLDRAGRQIAVVRGDLFQGKGWSEGVFSTHWTITVPADAAPGLYRLQVDVEQTRYAYRPPAMTWAGEKLESLLLEPLKMGALPPSSSELQAAHPANIQWGNQIALLGHMPLSKNARAGEVLTLSLYWKSLTQPTRDYTVFVHLLDAEGKLRAQVDAPPHGGAYPTSIWDVGEIVRDDYALALPRDLAPGAYRIEIGFYEHPSLTRLTVSDSDGQALGDRWVLADPVSVIR